MSDGSYDVRAETHDFDGRSHTYRIGSVRILPGHADTIRKRLARARLTEFDPYHEGGAIDVGMFIVFLDMPNGRVLTFGGAGGVDGDTSSHLRKCVDMLQEASVSWPLHGEDADVKAERSEIEQALPHFTPRGDKPYVCVYDLSSICRSADETRKLTESARESVAAGKWGPELGKHLETRSRRLFAMAPPDVQRLLREYLRQQGMRGNALDPIPPERLLPPRTFSERSITDLQTMPNDPMPEQLQLLRPVALDASLVRRLAGARLLVSIEKGLRHLDGATVAAVRSRRSPLLVCATLVRLMEDAEQRGDMATLARLKSATQRWEESAPWSSAFVPFFTRLVRSADRGRH